METYELKKGDARMEKKRLKIENPMDALPKDKGWAWMCLLGGFIINTLIAGGVFKSFGVIFTAVQERYQVSSGVISKIPAILLALAHGLSTPANLLAARYSTRWVVFCGGLLATTGFLLSAFAKSVQVMYITFGVFIGVGLSLSYGPSIVVVGQYFLVKRATANGVSFAGSGLGSFLLPSLIRYALDTYGLNGALLLMGGMTLNICVCGMLFRPPQFYFRRYIRKQRKQRRELDRDIMKTKELGNENEHNSPAEKEYSHDCVDGNGTNPVSTTDILQQRTTAVDETTTKVDNAKNKECTTEDMPHSSSDKNQPCCVNEAFSSTEVSTLNHNTTAVAMQTGSDEPQVSFIDVAYPSTANILSLDENESKSCLSHCCFKPVRSRISSTKPKPAKKKGDSFWPMLSNPVVLLYATSAGVSNSCFLSTFIMVPPHAEQLGFGSTNAALLVSIMGVADLLARVCVGWIADKNFIRKKYILHMCMVTGGSTLCLVPLLPSFWSLVVTLSLFAVANGTFIFMMPTLLAESLGIEKLPVAYGIANLFVGTACLFSPSVLGILKDVTGQWDTSFLVCGCLMFTIALLYFVEPWALKVGRRQLNYEDKKPLA